MKTIVAAIDFSAGSMNALGHAKKTAKLINQKLILIHAYSPPILDPNIPIGLIEETYNESVKSLEIKLIKEKEAAQSEGIETNYKIAFSDLNSIINEIEETEAISMVMVGKTNNIAFLDTLIGSTASHLIDNIKIPVLIIPEEYQDDLFRKLCYASQLEYDEIKFIERAVTLSTFSENILELVHIKETEELNIYPDEQFIKLITERFSKDQLEIIHKESRSFRKGIDSFINEEEISLLILTTHKRGLFEGLLNPSKTKQIIKHTKIPILVYSFE